MTWRRVLAMGAAALPLAAGYGATGRAQTSPPAGADAPAANRPAAGLRFLLPAADPRQSPRLLDPADLPSLRRTIAVDLDGVSRERALTEIGQAVGLSFVYASDVLPQAGTVVLKSPAIAVSEALERVLGGLALDLVLNDNGTAVLVTRQTIAASPAPALSGRPTFIRVELSEQASGLLIPGALVSLFRDDDGTVRVEGITDTRGVRSFGVPKAGEYRVEVRRIGFRPFTSDRVHVPAGETTHVALAMPSIVVTLPTVTSKAKAKTCGRGQGEPPESLDLWDQIRTALEAAQVTQADSSVRTFRRTFVRTGFIPQRVSNLTGRPNDGRLVSASQSLSGALPYAARGAERLSSQGYVVADSLGRVTYDGPDATTLLSPEFAQDHCFATIAGTGATSGLVGLAFVPASDRRLVDISGVLWVSARSDRLEYIDYQYVNLDVPAPGGAAGGRIVFERLEGGGWIVRNWVIRIPDFSSEVAMRSFTGLTAGMLVGFTKATVSGFGDAGGSAEPAVPSPRGASCPDSTTLLTATVILGDSSSTARPLQRAMVAVNWFDSATSGHGTRSAIGVALVATADTNGVARLCVPRHAGVPVAVAYASTLVSPVVPVPTTSGSAAIRLGIDIRDWVMVPSALPSPARLDVLVRDASGKPVEGAAIIATGQYPAAVTSGSGRASLTNLPAGMAIVDVWRPGYGRQRLAVDLQTKKTTVIEIRLMAEETVH